ncbi:MAG: RNA degradosome polyphosphate kinase, partial [Planctomycetes bacterium]|nr:RNA degradosome polyphosphate kinase [Planctomycetota bacterium]
GRFLEHSRVFYFGNGGEGVIYGASADWMARNLFRRVETCFPIEDERLALRVKSESLDVYLEDNVGAWELQPDGSYRRIVAASGEEARSAQQHLLNTLSLH